MLKGSSQLTWPQPRMYSLNDMLLPLLDLGSSKIFLPPCKYIVVLIKCSLKVGPHAKDFFKGLITHLLKNEWVLPNFVRRVEFSQMFSLVSNVPAIMTKVAMALHCTASDHIFTFNFMYRRAHFLTIEITFFIWVFSHISPSLCCLHDSKLKWLHTNWRIKLNVEYL